MKFRRQVVCFALLLASARCSAPPNDDAGVASDAGSSFDAGGSVDSGVDAGLPSVAVYTNLKLPNDSHAIDVFLPSNAVRVVVFLHGGGGSKEGAETKEIVIRLDDPVGSTPLPNSDFLLASKTAFVVPQGQSVGKAATWTNHVMTSGVDDVAFLTALSTALRSGALDPRVPAFKRVYVSGHSNGGMMANRLWCEAPAAFDAFNSLSGPASVQLDPVGVPLDGGAADPLTGAHPCAPTIAKPYLGVIGQMDTILETKARWAEDLWAVNSCLSSGAAGSFVDPNLISEPVFHRFRAQKVCNQTNNQPVTSADGKLVSWNACDGGVRLEAVVKAEHCVVESTLPCLNNKLLPSSCANSLEAEYGRPMREVIVEFFTSTE